MSKVILYTTQFCPFCVRAKALLERKGVSFDEIRVDLDASKRDEMLAKSDGRRTVPQIFINDQGIGGYNELWELEQAGKLDELLSQ